MATKTYSDGRVVKYDSKTQKVTGGNTVSRASVPNPPNVKQSVRESSAAPVAPETKPVGQTPVAPVAPVAPTDKVAPTAPVAPQVINSVDKAKAAGAFDAINGGGAYAKSLSQRMNEGLAAVKSGGAEAPTSQGQANNAISQVTPPAEYTPQPEIMTAVDDSLSEYSQAIAEYLNPKNQRQTLVKDYQQLSKSLGIDTLNAELLDINRIMDGTEDDIRSEVTAAAGFATESQVQAMTIGRNKSLLKKAQYISDQLVAAKDQLQTLSQLNAQDKQFAEQRMQTGIQLLGNMVQIKQSMQKAAQDNYRWYADKAGLDSLYASTGGDPFNVSMVEKTLGLPPGGLEKAAIQAQQQKARDAEKEMLQLDVLRSNLITDDFQRQAIMSNIETDKAQRANIYSQISERNKANQPQQPSPYQQERAYRTIQSVNELSQKATNNPGIFGKTAALPLPNFLRSAPYRDFKTELNTLKGNIAFNELTAMREASKTGGALGAISERELALLESTLGGLDMNQTPENFKKQLAKVSDSIQRWNIAQMGYSIDVPIIAPTGEEVIIVD